VETDDVMKLVREWLSPLFPDDPAEELCVLLRSGRRVTHTIPPVAGAARPKAAGQAEAGAGESVQSEVSSAILNVLADACRRHTRQEMAAALRDHFSESAVEKALWMLRKAGALNNRRDGYGGGFGLPEWE
jgi:hypothetical protein